MNTNASVPSYRLDHLSNDDLLESTRRMQGTSNAVLAGLLAHLAEVEARGIRLRACSSLYTYCIYELRMSEDAALRRAHAARFVRQFPGVLEPVGRGELQLTGLLMLGPHLTDANLAEVLARAKHRTKKEIAALVRELDPLPDVPDRVEPLGPTLPARGTGAWSEFAAALAGPVRELPAGERPANWIAASSAARLVGRTESTDHAPAPANPTELTAPLGEPVPAVQVSQRARGRGGFRPGAHGAEEGAGSSNGYARRARLRPQRLQGMRRAIPKAGARGSRCAAMSPSPMGRGEWVCATARR